MQHAAFGAHFAVPSSKINIISHRHLSSPLHPQLVFLFCTKPTLIAAVSDTFLCSLFSFHTLPSHSLHLAMLTNAWTFTPEDALGYYGTDPDTGLTEEQAKRNRELYGANCM